jgi:hypothetical protein
MGTSPSSSILPGGSNEFEPKAEPEFVFEIESVSGPEGEELELEQARAIRDFLLWLKDQRTRSIRGEEP